MTSIIDASVNGVVVTGSSTTALGLATNGTTRATIDTSGNISVATGNLTFSSTGQRITGDFSNGTFSNRLSFQSSTTNGVTGVQALPNGTNQTATFDVYNAADPTNASFGQLQINSGDVRVVSNIRGTGTYLPMTFYTGGSERMRLDTSGRELIGLTDAATVGGVNNSALQIFGGGAARINVMRGDANANSPAVFLSKSRSTSSGTFSALQSGDGCGAVSFYGDDGSSLVTNVARIEAFVDGAVSGSTVPGRLVFSTNPGGSTTPATERMRIDSSGNVGIGGTALGNAKCQILGTMPVLGGNTNSQSFFQNASVPSSITGTARGFISTATTDASSFTLTKFVGFQANQGTIGSGSTVTTQIGFEAASTLTGATNNYGFYSDIASGSNRWNFYAAGTARNYFAGRTDVGNTRIAETNGWNGVLIDTTNEITIADGGTITLCNTICASMMIHVYQTNNGNGGVFFATYATAVTKVAGDGEATDTGSLFAVYKSTNSHTVTLKNRSGASRNYKISIFASAAS